MVTATQSAHKRELGACWGNPADHGLTGVLDPEKRSSTACQFEKVLGQDQGVQSLVDLYQMFCAGLQSPSRPIGNRAPWFVGPGDPENAHLSMVYAGFRYVLPSTVGILLRVPYPN